MRKPSDAESQTVDALLSTFDDHAKSLEGLRDRILSDFQQSAEISSIIHSARARVKDRDHLREKLHRKIASCKKKKMPFEITPDNLLEKVNDLVGVRLIYLHTEQFPRLRDAISGVMEECRYNLVEGPVAKVWDDEYRKYFRKLKVKTERNDRMYTSVHYVIEPNRKTKYTAEIQVRTLAEELWGEVDHSVNYPMPSADDGCRDQIKILARVTLGCTRLVDSIFATHNRASKKPAKGSG